ncbi:MAG TPA: c-type cytochrome [Flavisolibacter sp.]|nr:c-type cytochrome [Flavisolibacter sp.]
MKKTISSNWFIILVSVITLIVVAQEFLNTKKAIVHSVTQTTDSLWQAPSLYTDQVTSGKERQMIMYGEELVANTAKYLGPRGTVKQITNGMNCQNCHLDAGTRPWGNNYGGVYSTYPKIRARSGSVENIYKRVNDCMERSLDGKALDTGSYEMQSIYAYMKWLGQGVAKGTKPHGAGLPPLPYMDRAADTIKGKQVYVQVCQTCHGQNGEGVINPGGTTYAFPPLWGQHSYNDGAGLYRISRFASFVKNNMPFNQASFTHPLLSDEEAWDVAAFVNSQPRPHKDQSKDWPDISKKSVDEPFGPYMDSFSETQHKFGPFKPIEEFQKNHKSAKNE